MSVVFDVVLVEPKGAEEVNDKGWQGYQSHSQTKPPVSIRVSMQVNCHQNVRGKTYLQPWVCAYYDPIRPGFFSPIFA